jgi:hypothetical protein
VKAQERSNNGGGEGQAYWGRRKKLTLSSSESSDEGEESVHYRSNSGGGRLTNGCGDDVEEDSQPLGGRDGQGDICAGFSTFLGEGAFEMIEELTLSRAENEELKIEIEELTRRVKSESARVEMLEAQLKDVAAQVKECGGVLCPPLQSLQVPLTAICFSPDPPLFCPPQIGTHLLCAGLLRICARAANFGRPDRKSQARALRQFSHNSGPLPLRRFFYLTDARSRAVFECFVVPGGDTQSK